MDIDLSHAITLFVGMVLGGASTGFTLENFVDTVSDEGTIQTYKAVIIGAVIGAGGYVNLFLVLLLSTLIGFVPARLIVSYILGTSPLSIIALSIAIGLYPAYQMIRHV